MRDPSFAQNQAVGSVAVKEFLEVVDHVVVPTSTPRRANHARGERPIVIPSAAILPILDVPGDVVAGEVLHGLLNGLAIGLGHVDQHTVHVEYQEVLFHQILSSSARTRLRLFASADGNADAAGDFVAAVADENGFVAQGVADFDGAVAEVSRMKFAELAAYSIPSLSSPHARPRVPPALR